MASILHIESSHSECSVSLSKGEKMIFNKGGQDSRSHHQLLPVLIDEAIKLLEADHSLDAIHLCSGPGSYTGLRIGFSIAKGLAYGYNIPLLLSSSNELLFEHAKTSFQVGDLDLVYTALSARPNEVYAQMFEVKGLTAESDLLVQVMDESFVELQEKHFGKRIAVVGNGLSTEGLSFDNTLCKESILPNSSMMIRLGLNKFGLGSFENILTCTPLYLKPPRVIKSKKKLFG